MFDLFAPSLWNFSNIREISRSSPLFRTVITLFYNNYLDVALRYVVYRARRVPYDNDLFPERESPKAILSLSIGNSISFRIE